MAERNGVIVVLGGTGRQGGAVARHLLRQGWPVRALIRDEAKPAARSLREMGAELVGGELDDPESLRAALKGAYGVFSVQTFMGPDGVAGEERQGKALAQAAADSEIQHLVYSSVGGAERRTGIPHFESKARIERAIRDLGLPSTILRPVFFMENLHLMGPRTSNGELVLGLGLRPGTPLQMIATDDIGAFAAAAFDRPGTYRGTAIEIAGDMLTGTEIAAEFGRAAGLPARFEQIPAERLRSRSEEIAMMFGWFDREGYRADIPALRRQHPGLSTLRDWLRATRWRPVSS